MSVWKAPNTDIPKQNRRAPEAAGDGRPGRPPAELWEPRKAGPRAPCSAWHQEGLGGGSAGVPMAEASLDPYSRQLLGGEWGPASVLGSPCSACTFPWTIEDARVMGSSLRRDCTDPQARHPLLVLTRTTGTLLHRWQEEERPQGLDTETLASLT